MVKKYKWVLENDVIYDLEGLEFLPVLRNERILFYQRNGAVIGIIDGLKNELTIKNGYAWNSYFKSKKASLIHDFVYQFLYLYKMPFSRKNADDIFLYFIKKDKVKFSKIYYWMLRIFGGLWLRMELTRKRFLF